MESKQAPMTTYIPAKKPELVVDWLKNPSRRTGTLVRPSNTPVVGRNDLCPCCSGKKFKRCCMGRK